MEKIRTTAKINIDGYDVDLDLDMDGNGTTGCWITRGRFGSSLESLSDFGVLESADFNSPTPHRVRQDTIDKIRKWAESRGY